MENINKLECKICNIQFTNYKELSYHVRKTHKISSKEYYDKYLKEKKEGICPVCGKPTNFNRLSKGYNIHCSRRCINLDKQVREKIENTNIKKYGVKNPFQSEEIKNKIKEQYKEKYRVEYITQVPEIRNKIINTNIKKFGAKAPAQNEEIQKKMEDTCIKIYGVKNGHNDIVNEKIKESNLNKYGVEYYFQSDEFKEKYKSTCLERYNSENIFGSEYGKQKIKETNIKKYGVEHPAQNREIQKKTLSHYKYNNLNFDSSWELAVYIYCIDHNINIERLPIRLEYYDKNNKKHYYFPDFLINNQLIEIKGPQYLDENGKLKDSFKQKCMENNNVILWTKENIEKYIIYCKEKFNDKYWYKQFKIYKGNN